MEEIGNLLWGFYKKYINRWIQTISKTERVNKPKVRNTKNIAVNMGLISDTSVYHTSF